MFRATAHHYIHLLKLLLKLTQKYVFSLKMTVMFACSIMFHKMSLMSEQLKQL